VDSAAVRRNLLLAGAVTAAACVAVSGVIGFVGLVVPHLMRGAVGPSHRRLLVASALGGALLLCLADALARTLLGGGEELPVGVVTALLGGPFFCYLLRFAPRTGAERAL
jgi:iron complex transport system permease protein